MYRHQAKCPTSSDGTIAPVGLTLPNCISWYQIAALYDAVMYKKYKRLFQTPKSSFFLFGPRGTGKTTLMEDTRVHDETISLLDEERYLRYLAQPGQFYEELNRLKPGSWVFINEIQRLPNLLNEVHRLIEGKRLRFAMTGSSTRKLRRSGVNLLTGRAVSRFLYPLTPMEMGQDFNLEKALTIGTLPLVVQAENPVDTLKAYVQTYLREEIQAEALVRNLSGFSRFLPIAALFHGQTINLANIARDAGVQRPTVQGFFEILKDTLLVQKIEAYSTSLRGREKRRSKFYFIDNGIAQALKGPNRTLEPTGIGPFFEGLIFMLLRFQKDTYNDLDFIHYWSPADAKLTEVDFVLSQGRDRIAIEAKSSTSLRPEDFLGLKAIGDLRNLRRRILVYRGKVDRITEDGIEIISFDSFTQLLKKRKL